MDRAAELGQYALDRLNNQLGDCPIVGDIRGRGLMFGIEIVTNRTDNTADVSRAETIYYASLAAGLSFKISAGSVLTLSPPLTISRDDLDRALDIVVTAIKDSLG